MLAEAKRAQFVERLEEWRANNSRIAIYFQTEGEIERFREIMAGTVEGVDFVEGSLARGFICEAAKLVVVTDAEIFGRYKIQRPRRLLKSPHALATRSALDIDFTELEEGDFVVHLQYGIGKFLGLRKFGPAGGPSSRHPSTLNFPTLNRQECLALEFADESPKLYVPLTRRIWLGLVGVGTKSPALSTLGDANWTGEGTTPRTPSSITPPNCCRAGRAPNRSSVMRLAPDTPWQRGVRGLVHLPRNARPDQGHRRNETDMERPSRWTG